MSKLTHPRPRRRARSTFALAVLSACSITPAFAAERSWISPTGGLFHDPANWAGGIHPGTVDTAVFGLGRSYIVTFNQGTSNFAARVINDNVSLNLGGATYATTS